MVYVAWKELLMPLLHINKNNGCCYYLLLHTPAHYLIWLWEYYQNIKSSLHFPLYVVNTHVFLFLPYGLPSTPCSKCHLIMNIIFYHGYIMVAVHTRALKAIAMLTGYTENIDEFSRQRHHLLCLQHCSHYYYQRSWDIMNERRHAMKAKTCYSSFLLSSFPLFSSEVYYIVVIVGIFPNCFWIFCLYFPFFFSLDEEEN